MIITTYIGHYPLYIYIISSSYYTFWSDLQGRRPEGAQAPEGEAL